MTTYCRIVLKTLYDGFEFYSSSVHKVENGKSVSELAKEIAKEQYDDCENIEEFDSGESEYCEFNGGTFMVSVYSAEEIPKDDYEILKKYFWGY